MDAKFKDFKFVGDSDLNILLRHGAALRYGIKPKVTADDRDRYEELLSKFMEFSQSKIDPEKINPERIITDKIYSKARKNAKIEGITLRGIVSVLKSKYEVNLKELDAALEDVDVTIPQNAKKPRRKRKKLTEDPLDPELDLDSLEISDRSVHPVSYENRAQPRKRPDYYPFFFGNTTRAAAEPAGINAASSTGSNHPFAFVDNQDPVDAAGDGDYGDIGGDDGYEDNVADLGDELGHADGEFDAPAANGVGDNPYTGAGIYGSESGSDSDSDPGSDSDADADDKTDTADADAADKMVLSRHPKRLLLRDDPQMVYDIDTLAAMVAKGQERLRKREAEADRINLVKRLEDLNRLFSLTPQAVDEGAGAGEHEADGDADAGGYGNLGEFGGTPVDPTHADADFAGADGNVAVIDSRIQGSHIQGSHIQGQSVLPDRTNAGVMMSDLATASLQRRRSTSPQASGIFQADGSGDDMYSLGPGGLDDGDDNSFSRVSNEALSEYPLDVAGLYEQEHIHDAVEPELRAEEAFPASQSEDHAIEQPQLPDLIAEQMASEHKLLNTIYNAIFMLVEDNKTTFQTVVKHPSTQFSFGQGFSGILSLSGDNRIGLDQELVDDDDIDISLYEPSAFQSPADSEPNSPFEIQLAAAESSPRTSPRPEGRTSTALAPSPLSDWTRVRSDVLASSDNLDVAQENVRHESSFVDAMVVTSAFGAANSSPVVVSPASASSSPLFVDASEWTSVARSAVADDSVRESTDDLMIVPFPTRSPVRPPIQSSPKTGPIQSGPVQSDPTQSDPTQPDPNKPDPTKPGPTEPEQSLATTTSRPALQEREDKINSIFLPVQSLGINTRLRPMSHSSIPSSTPLPSPMRQSSRPLTPVTAAIPLDEQPSPIGKQVSSDDDKL